MKSPLAKLAFLLLVPLAALAILKYNYTPRVIFYMKGHDIDRMKVFNVPNVIGGSVVYSNSPSVNVSTNIQAR